MILRNFNRPGSTEPGLVSKGLLLRECMVFMERKGMKRCAFGRAAAGDPNLIRKMHERLPSDVTVARVRRYLDANV